MIQFLARYIRYFTSPQRKWLFILLAGFIAVAIIIRVYISYKNHVIMKEELYAFMHNRVIDVEENHYAPSVLTEWDIFGRADNAFFNLVLVGTFVSTAPKLRFAILAEDGGKQKAYYIGQMLPGGGRLREIAIDHVSIELNGNKIVLKRKQAEIDTVFPARDAVGSYMERLQHLQNIYGSPPNL